MFTRVIIRNFLSLRDIEIKLGKVNVLIGPNASGKSNIARALQLITKHANGGEPALDGYKSLVDLSFNFNPKIDIYLALDMPIGIADYWYSLQLTSRGYEERVGRQNEVVISHTGEKSEAEVKVEGATSRVPLYPIAESRYYHGSLYKSVLTSLPSDVDREIHHLASNLRNISVHSFTPDRLRLSNSVSQKPILDYYGGNLARYLLYLYTERRKDFERVEKTLCSLIPEIEEIMPHIERTDVEIWIKVKGIEEPLKPHNISDGTLRLLAMVAALYGGSSLVVLEEPENCIHPYLLETFMNLVRDAPSQVIMTTHSPYLLDHVKPEEVYVVTKEGLETKVKRLSDTSEMEQVKRFLEEGGTLGEAWYSGIFGGTP